MFPFNVKCVTRNTRCNLLIFFVCVCYEVYELSILDKSDILTLSDLFVFVYIYMYTGAASRRQTGIELALNIWSKKQETGIKLKNTFCRDCYPWLERYWFLKNGHKKGFSFDIFNNILPHERGMVIDFLTLNTFTYLYFPIYSRHESKTFKLQVFRGRYKTRVTIFRYFGRFI